MHESFDSMGTRPLAQAVFADAAPAWLESRKPFLSQRTIEDYANYIPVLSGFFGELRLPEINADQIRAYQRMRMARAPALPASTRNAACCSRC